jgi:predicted nucleic acid-binding protein
MGLPRIVVDNSAMLPAFFAEDNSDKFDAGLVTNRSRSLVQAIRMRCVNAYVPPSFFREFLNVATQPLYRPEGRTADAIERIRDQWDDLLRLPLITLPLKEIIHHSGTLAFDEACPAADTWYVASAVHVSGDLWLSHAHQDGVADIAKNRANVVVRLLSDEAPNY